MEGMLRARVKAKTSPCTYRTHATRTARMLVHTKWFQTQKCVEVDTVCKTYVHVATLKIKVIMFLLQDTRIQTR